MQPPRAGGQQTCTQNVRFQGVCCFPPFRLPNPGMFGLEIRSVGGLPTQTFYTKKFRLANTHARQVVIEWILILNDFFDDETQVCVFFGVGEIGRTRFVCKKIDKAGNSSTKAKNKREMEKNSFSCVSFDLKNMSDFAVCWQEKG